VRVSTSDAPVSRRLLRLARITASLLRRSRKVGEEAEPPALELPDPAFGDLVDGHGVQVVELLPPAPADRDEVGCLEDFKALGDRLPRHGDPGTAAPWPGP
jgi:hypothetical protein